MLPLDCKFSSPTLLKECISGASYKFPALCTQSMANRGIGNTVRGHDQPGQVRRYDYLRFKACPMAPLYSSLKRTSSYPDLSSVTFQIMTTIHHGLIFMAAHPRRNLCFDPFSVLLYPCFICFAVVAGILLLGLAEMCRIRGSTRVESGRIYCMTAKISDGSGNVAIPDVSLEQKHV